MLTPEALLDIAIAEEDAETHHQRRASRKALILAAWMERNGMQAIAGIDGLGEIPVRSKTHAIIKKGALIHSMKAKEPPTHAGRSYTIMVNRVDEGFIDEWEQTVRLPQVHWVGASGYWKWCSIEHVIPVPVCPALPA